MKRHPIIGTLSLAAAVLPLLMATGFMLGLGVRPTDWLFLQYAVPAFTVFAAGVLLISGHRQAYFWGIVGWALLIVAALLNLAFSWWSFAPGSQFPTAITFMESIYVAIGIAVLAFLAKERRRGKDIRASQGHAA